LISFIGFSFVYTFVYTCGQYVRPWGYRPQAYNGNTVGQGAS